MPRSIILSNGNLFVGIDNRLRIRDLCFPGVGGPNHLNGRSIRFGIWVRNEFSWIDSDDWTTTFRQANWGFSAVSTARHRNSLIALDFEFDLSPESSFLAIAVTVHNLGGSSEDVRIFCTEQLCINESDIGDTALFHAPSGAMLHFKANVGFAFYGGSEVGGITSYSCGIKDFGGAEGTFRDAEDGALANHPIAQGSVDCSFSVGMKVPALGHLSAWFAIVALLNPLGRDGQLPLISGEDCEKLRRDCHSNGQELATRFGPKFDRLPSVISEFAIKSIPMLLGHCDPSGAIMAAVDSDIMSTNRAHYRYCWMRDGANVALLFLDLGIIEPAVHFLEFCERVLDPVYPAFLQKYTASGDVGATWHPWLSEERETAPIQEDETALVLLLLSRAIKEGHVEPQSYRKMQVRLAEFLISFRDKQSSLPLPSYDLWEERFGIHLNTVSAVVSALQAASSNFPNGFEELSEAPSTIAKAMKEAALKAFWDKDSMQFGRTIDEHGNLDLKPDAANLLLMHLRIIEPLSDVANSLIESIHGNLKVISSVSGISRYQSDYYFRISEEYPGNPWIITTMWLSQVLIQRAREVTDLEEPTQWLRWAINLAGESGILAEQYHPATGEPLSVSPLTWSHAEFLKTALQLQSWLVAHNCSLA